MELFRSVHWPLVRYPPSRIQQLRAGLVLLSRYDSGSACSPVIYYESPTAPYSDSLPADGGVRDGKVGGSVSFSRSGSNASSVWSTPCLARTWIPIVGGLCSNCRYQVVIILSWLGPIEQALCTRHQGNLFHLTAPRVKSTDPTFKLTYHLLIIDHYQSVRSRHDQPRDKPR